jgi:predicted lipoprotein with Yx(FWY)xxD motif
MDMRTVLRWSPDAAQYCTGECAKTWEPLLAGDVQPNISFPAERSRRGGNGAKTQASPALPYTQRDAPDWTVIAGPQGPQWVYKGWHLVFTHRGDSPGSAALDGAQDRTWNTLKFVPPLPKISAPSNVQPIFLDGAYVLADAQGRVLFTGKCGKNCAAWRPFAAGMASSGIGAWKVGADADAPQWTYRGQPVFVSEDDDPKAAPTSGKLLHP